MQSLFFLCTSNSNSPLLPTSLFVYFGARDKFIFADKES